MPILARVTAVCALAASLGACAPQGPLSEQDQQNRRLAAILLMSRPRPLPVFAPQPQVRCTSIRNGDFVNTTCQ
jgi:hypothetical protein